VGMLRFNMTHDQAF